MLSGADTQRKCTRTHTWDNRCLYENRFRVRSTVVAAELPNQGASLPFFFMNMGLRTFATASAVVNKMPVV